MKKSINFDQVSDIYDNYVTVDFDIPFYLKETEKVEEEILELACGTGRVSIPLLQNGRKLTCVDYSKGMLEAFSKKIEKLNYKVNLVEMDLTQWTLDKKFGFIIFPFHSISEIINSEDQKNVLKYISEHLKKSGTFILTLQNPNKRLIHADGKLRILGEFPIKNDRKVIISAMNKYNPDDKIVSGYQVYEIYDASNSLIEKRSLDVKFRPISDAELKSMILPLDLQILETFGDYNYGKFIEEESDFIIYKMTR